MLTSASGCWLQRRHSRTSLTEGRTKDGNDVNVGGLASLAVRTHASVQGYARPRSDRICLHRSVYAGDVLWHGRDFIWGRGRPQGNAGRANAVGFVVSSGAAAAAGAGIIVRARGRYLSTKCLHRRHSYPYTVLCGTRDAAAYGDLRRFEPGREGSMEQGCERSHLQRHAGDADDFDAQRGRYNYNSANAFGQANLSDFQRGEL